MEDSVCVSKQMELLLFVSKLSNKKKNCYNASR